MEVAASAYYGGLALEVFNATPGVVASQIVPPTNLGGPVATAHIMGTARMGKDPTASVTDAWGRLHDVDNVYLADGSVFVSSGGFNPTLTIMALSMRMARALAGNG